MSWYWVAESEVPIEPGELALVVGKEIVVLKVRREAARGPRGGAVPGPLATDFSDDHRAVRMRFGRSLARGFEQAELDLLIYWRNVYDQ